MYRLLLTSILAALTFVVATGGAAADAPRVSVISDSILTSVTYHQENMVILEQGLDLDMQVAICRRLAGTSCPFEGVAPPTLFDLLPTLATIAPTVVVEMGYNDDPATFRANVEETIARLTARGVTRIIWPTLHVCRSEFAGMNQVLVDEMLAHPQLTLVDWDAYSAGHNDWFQTDNLHLTVVGGAGIATLLHHVLTEPLSGRTPQAVLPVAKRGQRYQAQVGDPAAEGSWQLLSGRMPQGIHLSPSGALSGRPLRAGSTSAELLFRSDGFELAHQLVRIRVQSVARKTSKAATTVTRRTAATVPRNAG